MNTLDADIIKDCIYKLECIGSDLESEWHELEEKYVDEEDQHTSNEMYRHLNSIGLAIQNVYDASENLRELL